jgi:hypothetical protein
MVWYCGHFGQVEYEGLVRGPADHQPDAGDPTYMLTLLSGPYAGDTSTVYACELRPHVHPVTTHHSDSVEPGAAAAAGSARK